MSEEAKSSESDLPNLTTANEASWENLVIQSEIPVVVNFWAAGCSHCEKFSPTFEMLSHRFINRMKFVRVDVDQQKDLANRYGILSVPSLLYFYQGRPYFSVIGEAPRHQLEAEMRHILAQHKRCSSRSSARAV